LIVLMFYVEKPVGLTTSSKRNPARLMIGGVSLFRRWWNYWLRFIFLTLTDISLMQPDHMLTFQTFLALKQVPF